MSDTRSPRILPLIPTILLLAALACDFPGSTPTQAEPEASDTLAPNTATATETVAEATDTTTPEPPTATHTLAPPSATSTTSPWVFVSGTWSGCVTSSGPPTTTGPCASALGPFVTLYLQPTCVIGQHCGNYVKGAFESEYIIMKLTLIGINGSTIRMHADAGSGMYASSSTNVKIERVGAYVRITEITGSDVVLLPPGCDSKIQTQTTIGCSEHVP